MTLSSSRWILVRQYLILLFLFSISFVVQAQSYWVRGTVTTENGVPISGVKIRMDSPRPVAVTRGDGSFVVKNVAPGTHLFSLEYKGEDRKNVELQVSGDTTIVKPWVLELDVVGIQGVHISGAKKSDIGATTIATERLNREYIERNRAGSLMQSLEKLPGIKNISVGSSTSKPLIRGLGFNEIAVIENGIKHEGQQWGSDHGLEIDQYNVNSVEIVKGPSSFIYGSDALGGVIDIRSIRRPEDDTVGGSIDLIGQSNNLEYGSSVNLYARKNRWFFDGRVTYLDYGDYRVPADTVYIDTYAVPLHKNFVRNTAGSELNNSATVGYVGDRFNTAFYMSHVHNESGFFANAHGLEPRNVDQKLHDASNRDIQMPFQEVSHLKLLNQTQWKLKNHNVELHLAYQRNFRHENSSYVGHGYMPANYPDNLKYSRDLELEFDKEIVSADIKDKIKFGKHQLHFGINGEFQKNEIGGWLFLIPSFDYYKVGGFVFDTFDISDSWKLFAALRYDYGKINSRLYRDWFESDLDGSSYPVRERLVRSPEFKKNYESLTGAAGVQYKKNHWDLKLNVGKGFRMPLAQELASNGVNYHYFRFEKGNKDLDPESSYQADLNLGWKSDALEVKLSPFINYYTNYIYLNPTSRFDNFYGAGNQVYEYTQARVLRVGAEAQMGIRISDAWRTELSGEFLNNRQLSGAKKGYTLPFTTPASGLVRMFYEPSFASNMFTNTYFNVDARFTAAQNQIVPPEWATPSSQVFSFSMGTDLQWGKQKIQANFSIRNIFNTRYLNHTSFYRLIELPEQGRNFILTLKIPFGYS